MTKDQWTDCAMRQLWAEGIDWRAVVPTGEDVSPQHLEAWLQYRDKLPRRELFKYPGPEQTRLGVPFYAVFVNDLAPRVERLWAGALRSVGPFASLDDPSAVDRVAHWRLNLLIGKTLSTTPDQVVALWVQYPHCVQETQAEQQVVHWYAAHEPWRERWHPGLEGSGALRRAPIWGALFWGAPQQAAAAAVHDAGTAHQGWGVHAAAVVSYSVARLSGDWAPATAAESLVDAMTRVDSHWPGMEAVNGLLRDYYPGTSWDAWCQLVDTEFAGYPTDHSLPNLLLITGALHWYATGTCEDMFEALARVGWDVSGTQWVAGALRGEAGNQENPDHAALLHSLVTATVKAHGSPPNVEN